MLIFRACSKNLFFCRPENLTGMRKSKRSGCPFFSPFSLGKQRQPYGLNVALATARSARRSRSKMGSPFGRNQNINARLSRSKMKSTVRSKPKLTKNNKGRKTLPLTNLTNHHHWKPTPAPTVALPLVFWVALALITILPLSEIRETPIAIACCER